MQFEDLNLIHHLLRAVRTEGYTEPTPIQEQAIPHVLEGRDVLGCAQTGTGKTAAFALPILQRLSANPTNGNGHRAIRTLVLAPTRELANQIGESFRAYGRHTGMRAAIIYGGVGQNPQVQALRAGVDILVATPGRLLDLMGQGFVRLGRVEILVLDEADRMLDMGFIHDVRRIVEAVPAQRQTLLFSATMPADIQKLADDILTDPVQVAVSPPTMTVDKTEQGIYFVEKNDKTALLEHLLGDPSVSRVLVFTRTKHGANKVVKQLDRARIQAESIHSNKSQTARERALANFKSGRTRVLVATDIAARGIDVDNISHVINYDLPNEPETYVHRIGRTGRAGETGIALSFCAADERPYLKDIERLIRQRIAVVQDHPYASTASRPSTAADAPKRQRPSGAPRRFDRPSGQANTGRRQRPAGEPRGSNQRPSAPADAPKQQPAARAASEIDPRQGNNGHKRYRRRGNNNPQARQPQAPSIGREQSPRPASPKPAAQRPPAPAPAPASAQPRRAPRLIR